MTKTQELEVYCPNCSMITKHKIRKITTELADKFGIPDNFIGQYACKCEQCKEIHTGSFLGQ